MQGVIGAFVELDSTVHAIEELKKRNFREITIYSPAPRHELEEAVAAGPSKVRRFTLIGGLMGLSFGDWIPIWDSDYLPLVVGGKPVTSCVPYTIIGFVLRVPIGPIFTGARMFALGPITALPATVWC